MRKCNIIERSFQQDPETRKRSFVETISEGVWLDWGVDFAEFESSGAPYTAGIIEMPDGKVKLIRADDIQFKDKDGAANASTKSAEPAPPPLAVVRCFNGLPCKKEHFVSCDECTRPGAASVTDSDGSHITNGQPLQDMQS